MFYKETNFKETVIGRVPEDWEVIKLGTILNLKNGERPKVSEIGSVPIYGANGVMGYTNEFLVDNDFTIVIGRVGASGEIHLAKGKVWISDNAIYSESYNKLKTYLPFLFYLLKFKRLDQFASKTTHPIITQTFLKNFSIQLPKLVEQQKIAEILSTIDEVIQKTNEIITKTERLKNGLMQELLTRGIGHKEFKDTEIGRVPKEWDVIELGKVANVRKEVILPEQESAETVYVGLEHMESCTTKLKQWGKAGDVKSAKFRFYRNDILYGKLRPYLDKAVLADMNGVCSTDIIVIQPQGVLPSFLAYILHRKEFISYATATMIGTNHPRTSWTSIAKFKFGLPDLREQAKITEVLSSIEKKLEIERNEKQKLERIKQGLMDLLLTGKIRIEVN